MLEDVLLLTQEAFSAVLSFKNLIHHLQVQKVLYSEVTPFLSDGLTSFCNSFTFGSNKCSNTKYEMEVSHDLHFKSETHAELFTQKEEVE